MSTEGWSSFFLKSKAPHREVFCWQRSQTSKKERNVDFHILLDFYVLTGANLINVLVAFFKPACVLVFSEAFYESYKEFKSLDFFQKSFQP